jgi:hypothetical protein
MSLCISVVTSEGIVVAGESRQTQTIANINRVASDSVMKVFQLKDTVLAATAGSAFLRPQNSPQFQNIASLVEDFKPSIAAGSTVQEVATSLWNHFNTLYQEHIVNQPNDRLPPGQVALYFIVAGYDPGSRVGKLFSIEIPSTVEPTTEVRSTNNPGPWWMGQIDVIARIVRGFDPKVFELQFVKDANRVGNAGTTQLVGMEYIIFWSLMTLQDAVDFAVDLIRVTITVQRFIAGTTANPGFVAGVGGSIDVAVVQPGETVKWIARKELKA